MNIKMSVALAVLAVSTVGVSACASSASKTTTAGAGSTVSSPTTASTTTDPAGANSSSSSSAPASTASSGGKSGGSSGGTASRTDIPGNAMLVASDLAAAPSGTWQQFGGSAVPGIQAIDPDNCDPTPRPQYVDPKYPHNPAWVNARTLAWSSANSMAQVTETVITYTSAATANTDFVKHQGWATDCASHFQWTDAPMKFTIAPAQLTGITGSYAIRVAMDPADHAGSAVGSQGVDYMAVILRGNSLTVVNVSDTGAPEQNPKDPGLSTFQHTVQTAATKLNAVYTSIR